MTLTLTHTSTGALMTIRNVNPTSDDLIALVQLESIGIFASLTSDQGKYGIASGKGIKRSVNALVTDDRPMTPFGEQLFHLGTILAKRED